MSQTALKYWHLYLRDPTQAHHYIEALRWFIVSLTLQRGFGESMESFLERRPDLKARIKDCERMIERMERALGKQKP